MPVDDDHLLLNLAVQDGLRGAGVDKTGQLEGKLPEFGLEELVHATGGLAGERLGEDLLRHHTCGKLVVNIFA